MRDDVENTNRSLAAVFTVVFHGILFLIIFFVVFKTPLPPYPEVGGGSGLEVNFGNTDKGFGDNKSEQLIDVQTQQLTASSDDDNITQDNEETTSLSSTHKKPTKTKASVIKINDPVVDQSKLYTKRSNQSQGIAGGNGNQGKENGNVNSSNYTGKGGSGGDSDDGGNGHGHGTGTGNGTSYNLADRTNLYLPKPEYNSDDQGIVIVTITVDQTGKVTKAKAGAKGTTVTDKSLWKQSEQAAYRAKFNKKKDATIEQIGTITYHFLKLN